MRFALVTVPAEAGMGAAAGGLVHPCPVPHAAVRPATCSRGSISAKIVTLSMSHVLVTLLADGQATLDHPPVRMSPLRIGGSPWPRSRGGPPRDYAGPHSADEQGEPCVGLALAG